MKRRTGRWSAGVLTFLLPVAALACAMGVGRTTAAAAASRPAQAATTVPGAGTVAATTVPAPAAPVETAVPGSPTTAPAPVSDQVGDPVADRRIRNIVLALGALALIVLITTIVFWRKTKPVPAALDGLRRLGSRSGRQAALAVEAAGLAPPSVAGGGVARPGVSVRPAAAVLVADADAEVEGADAGASKAEAGDAGVDLEVALAEAEVPVVEAEVPVVEAEVPVVDAEAGAAQPDVRSERNGGPPAEVVPAAADALGPASSLPGPAPAAEVVPASAPPPAPGTSLREDG